jgi:hypothetical protein
MAGLCVHMNGEAASPRFLKLWLLLYRVYSRQIQKHLLTVGIYPIQSISTAYGMTNQ